LTDELMEMPFSEYWEFHMLIVRIREISVVKSATRYLFSALPRYDIEISLV